jgi:hypothetical protein
MAVYLSGSVGKARKLLYTLLKSMRVCILTIN